MTRRFIATLAVVALSASPAAAQSAGTYAAPRTPDGQPDLQGMWNNETLTPFERPTSMADKAFLTEEEAAARNQQSDERRAAADAASEVRTEPLPVGGNIGGYNQFWFDPGRRVLSARQTSMVVDPPDGRVPVKPWAVAARTHNLAHVGDSYVHMSVWDRCLSRGVPGSMFPAGYNNAYRILQTPDHVTIIYEMIHDVRIIPLDNRPHIDRDIKPVDGQFPRPLGRGYAGGRDPQLPQPGLDRLERRGWTHQGHPDEQGALRGRAVYARLG